MATDLVYNISAHDNASQQLQKIKASFEKIGESTKPLKGKLREIQKLLADMNMNGLTDTPLFTEMAQSAGQMKDAISDASTAVNRFANDTMSLAAAADALKLVAGAGAIATSAMQLFGTESEDVQKAILKVQSALTILNGVQTIANTLNKDSALIQKIKQISLNTTTAATVKNTVAEGANTVATTANTVAQKAWNVAVAIGKALLGDWTGLLLVAGAGLITYSLYSDNAKSKQDELNNSLTDAKKRQEEYAQGVASSAASQLVAYRSLQQKWNECNGDVEKQRKFMEDYKSEIKATGLKIDSLTDAESIFVTNTNSVVEAIMARAKAQAAYNLAVKEMEKKLERQNNKTVENGGMYVPATKWSDLTDEEKAVYEKDRTKKFDLNEVNRNRNQQALNLQKNLDAQSDRIIEQYTKQAEKAGEEASKYFKKDVGGSGAGGGSGRGGSNDTNNLIPGSVAWLNEEIKKREDILKNQNNTLEDERKILAEIVNLEKERDEIVNRQSAEKRWQKVAPKWQVEVEKAQQQKVDKMLKKILNEPTELFVSNQTDLSNVKVDLNKTREMRQNSLRDFYDKQMQEIRQLQDDYNIGIIDEDKFLESFEHIRQLLENAGLTVEIKPELKEKEWQKGVKSAANALGELGDMFSSLASATGDEELNVMGVIAQSIANIALGTSKAISEASSLGPWGWIAFGAAAMAQMAAMIAQVHSATGFAEGGIVGGSSYSGDKLLARLNSGEMVLNQKQQANLFKQINSGVDFNGGNDVVTSTVRIKGSDLYIALQNHSKITGKKL